MRRLSGLSLGRRLVVALVFGGAVFGIATAVQADIPDGGVVNGCYQKVGGSLRVIDTSKGDSCRSSESPISWSQTGPKGTTGATGHTGPSGPAGTARAWAIVEADGTIDHQVNVSSVEKFAKAGDYCVFLNGIDASTAAAVATVTGTFDTRDVAVTFPGVCGSQAVFVHIWNTETNLGEFAGFSIVVP